MLQPKKVTGLDLAFGGNMKDLLPAEKDIPKEFWHGHGKWNDLVSSMFFCGGKIKSMKPKEGIVETNVYALIGREAIVVEEINPSKNIGRVKIRGEEWGALSQDSIVIPIGSKVKVVEISGNKVIVKLYSKGE